MQVRIAESYVLNESGDGVEVLAVLTKVSQSMRLLGAKQMPKVRLRTNILTYL